MFRRSLVATLAIALFAATPVGASEPESFETLIDELGRTMLARYPEEATDLGLSSELGLDDSRLNDRSPEYVAETADLAREGLERLAAVDLATLTPDQHITHAITSWYLDDVVTMHGYADHEYPLNFITGLHVNLPEFMADVHPLENLADAKAYVARLEAADGRLAQVGKALVRAESAGVLPTRRGLEIARWQLGQAVVPAAQHPLVTEFAARLDELELQPADHERLLSSATDAVAAEVLPAYAALLELAERAASRPDAQPGALGHPAGAGYYAAVLRHHTGTSMTPAEMHQLGLAEVVRVRGELTTALLEAGYDATELGFTGAIDAARRATPVVPLRGDEDREALLAETEAFIAATATTFDELFPALPSATIEVQRPRPGREGAAGAYYRPPPVDGSRPGIYYLGLGGNGFPMDTYATTNFHEAVPGHHFQLALQRESESLPLLQRAISFTGYAEGWALYAERLAHEAGLYEDDPLGDIGRLRMELLRAARVVADTGIHALGWSRDEAIGYLMEQGLPAGWAASEVDRYIVWPGQAPAYTIGMTEILRLRDEAQAALGDDFEVAAFHDAVLRHGSVPLEVLPMAVEAYIAEAST